MIGQKIGEGQFGMVLEGTLITGEWMRGCGVITHWLGECTTKRIGLAGCGIREF